MALARWETLLSGAAHRGLDSAEQPNRCCALPWHRLTVQRAAHQALLAWLVPRHPLLAWLIPRHPLLLFPPVTPSAVPGEPCASGRARPRWPDLGLEQPAGSHTLVALLLAAPPVPAVCAGGGAGGGHRPGGVRATRAACSRGAVGAAGRGGLSTWRVQPARAQVAIDDLLHTYNLPTAPVGLHTYTHTYIHCIQSVAGAQRRSIERSECATGTLERPPRAFGPPSATCSCERFSECFHLPNFRDRTCNSLQSQAKTAADGECNAVSPPPESGPQVSEIPAGSAAPWRPARVPRRWPTCSNVECVGSEPCRAFCGDTTISTTAR